MIDFDELRKTVAIKHNVLLESNDPILVTVTLHELVLSRYVEILAAAIDANQRAIAAALSEHLAQSKEAGSRVITDAANYVSDRARSSVEAALAEGAALMRADLQTARNLGERARADLAAASAAKSTALVAAIVAGAAAVVAIIVLAVILLK